ncbi:MAG: tetratricopeptide repeat protein [Rickettsiaceae bacterium]|nr:tetratricopeptide repeat protein [Rickettsiaceae bacterium]
MTKYNLPKSPQGEPCSPDSDPESPQMKISASGLLFSQAQSDSNSETLRSSLCSMEFFVNSQTQRLEEINATIKEGIVTYELLKEKAQIYFDISTTQDITHQEYLSKANKENALSYFKKAIKLLHSEDYLEKSICLNNIALTLYELNDFEKAKSTAKNSLSTYPNGKAYEILGQIHNMEGHFKRALHDFENALRCPDYIEGNDVKCLYHIAITEAALGNKKLALATLEEANSKSYDHLNFSDKFMIEEMKTDEYKNIVLKLANDSASNLLRSHHKIITMEDSLDESNRRPSITDILRRLSPRPIKVGEQLEEMQRTIDSLNEQLKKGLERIESISTAPKSEQDSIMLAEKASIKNDPYKFGLYKQFKSDLLATYTASQALSTDMIANKPSEVLGRAGVAFSLASGAAPGPVAVPLQIMGTICKTIDDHKIYNNAETFKNIVADPAEMEEFAENLATKIAIRADTISSHQRCTLNNIPRNLDDSISNTTEHHSLHEEGKAEGKKLAIKVEKLIFQDNLKGIETIHDKISFIIRLIESETGNINFAAEDIDPAISDAAKEILTTIKNIAETNHYQWKSKPSLEAQFVLSLSKILQSKYNDYGHEEFTETLNILKQPLAESLNKDPDIIFHGKRFHWYGEKAKISDLFLTTNNAEEILNLMVSNAIIIIHDRKIHHDHLDELSSVYSTTSENTSLIHIGDAIHTNTSQMGSEDLMHFE